VRLIEGEQRGKDEAENITLEMRIIRDSWEKVDLSSQSLLENHSLDELCRMREMNLKQNMMYYI
jgi:hypothetical protein